MDVRCDKCGTEYEFDENRVGANGVTVKCTACGFVFKVRRPRRPPPRATTTIGKGPQGREWLVRKPDGQMIAFRELTTLQKWIVEGRISRDDEISKNGETWKRLGNIMELEPFFSVYEKARTLNTLIDQGSQLEIRGSEVLSASNPIPQPLSQPPIPPASTGVSQQTLPPPPLASEPPPQVPPPQRALSVSPMGEPPRPPLQGTMPMPAGTGPGDTLPVPLETPHNGAAPAPSAPTFPSNVAKSIPPAHSGIQPAAAPRLSTDLSFPINDDLPERETSNAIVDQFQKSQKRKRFFLFVALLVLAGVAGGVFLAMYGPEGNPAKALAIKYGLLPELKIEDGADRLMEDAQAAADLDTVPSLQKAAGLLEKAELIRPKQANIPAERALVLVTQAGTHLRHAKDLSSGEDKAAEEAKRQAASPLLTEAFQLATGAAAKDPTRLEPARALAAYHLMQGDQESYAKAIGKTKAMMEKAGRVDPATLYLEATAAIKDPAAPAAEGVDRAKTLLRQALTTRPTMNRARVLLARLHLAQNAPGPAKLELERVLATAPAHEEAKRILAAVPAEAAPPPPPAEEKKDPPPPAAEKKKKEEPRRTYDYWMQRADSLRERDRTKAAMNAYGRAAELRPGSAEPHTGKGWCFLDLDRPRLALGAFQKAISKNDRYVVAYYGLAESYRALKDKEKAIEAFEQYLSRAPANSPDRRTAERALKRLKGEQ